MDNTFPKVKSEILSSTPDKQLIELRKYAIEQGIPPMQVDRYLLSQQWVSPEVKALIQNAEVKQQAGAGPSEGMEYVPTPNQHSVPDAAPMPGREAIKGTIEVFDSNQEMQKIKQEFGEQQLPEQEGDNKAEQISQTAESKEQTTTSATQNTDDGFFKRLEVGVSGYPVSDQVASNFSDIAEKGEVGSASTWQAALVERIVEMWNNISNLISPQG